MRRLLPKDKINYSAESYGNIEQIKGGILNLQLKA